MWLGICQYNRDLAASDPEEDDGTDWSARIAAVAAGEGEVEDD